MAAKHPPLPSNYVSLAVLKGRWLEQQRKQSEEEELQRKHEEDQKKKIQNQNGDESLQKSQSSSLRASRRNYQVTRMRGGQTSVASIPTLKESKSEASVSELNKKAKENKETRRKPRAEITLSVPTSRWPPVKILQVNTTERKEKIEEAGCEFPHNSVDQANHDVWKPRVKMGIAGRKNHQYSRAYSKGGFSSGSPPVEKLQADTTEKNFKIEEAGCEIPHKIVDQAANHNVSKPRVRMGIAGKTNHQYSREYPKGGFSSRSPPVDKQADTKERNEKLEEAGCEFPHDSVDQAANHNVSKPSVRMSTEGRTNYRYSRYSKRGNLHQKKQTDCKQVWVKKGETTATQSSGVFMNAGGANSSNSSQDTNRTMSIW